MPSAPDTARPRVLFVDDELPLRDVVSRLLDRRGVDVTTAGDAITAVEILRDEPFDLVLTDFQMPGMDGLELLAHVREHYPDLPAVMITGHASVQHAVRAMAGGAVDYLPKPFAVDALAERVLEQISARAARRARRAARPDRPVPAKRLAAGGFVGEHPAIVRLRNLVDLVAASQAPVFVHGESGTGKEVMARYIHQRSERPGPFVAINCANLPRELVESALFGHKKGAFTGATGDHTGVFEEAHGGTLLLDEVTEVEPAVQAKLLRVLQEGEVQPVGAKRPKSVDVRIVATTNRDVSGAIAEGAFREDLYHRLAVFPVSLPPLRERGDDIRLLAERFVEKYRALYGLGPKTIARELMDRFLASAWPGNVRQLENLVHRGVVLSAGREAIEVGDVEHVDLIDATPSEGEHRLAPRAHAVTTLDEMERAMILRALEETGGNQVQAAERLGISDRTIRNKLKRYKEEGHVD
ncbi:sigma-54-dependent transcriptional regulator [Rubrivirga marina]|uniref:Sigma-54-dependent Fis family transcriptional regulator n=1 Tax=Rubrivirga marina TaxID=1196024 RepID=A0A271IYK3_9BACT|nr:sigma-54 dependent transcriptional regulator [Rubrivirga marina]PAP75775.1 sigma-54-dependent Fis family transcriptional regulator [Rubrivirga marina]